MRKIIAFAFFLYRMVFAFFFRGFTLKEAQPILQLNQFCLFFVHNPFSLRAAERSLALLLTTCQRLARTRVASYMLEAL
jgi:hypothetical protein